MAAQTKCLEENDGKHVGSDEVAKCQHLQSTRNNCFLL